jgi:hypothetical protein
MHRQDADKLLVYLGTQSRSRSTPRVPRPRPVLQRFVIRRRRLALFRLLPAHQTVKHNVAFEQGIWRFEHGGRLAPMCRSRSAADRLGTSTSCGRDGSSSSTCRRIGRDARTRNGRRQVARLWGEIDGNLVQAVLRAMYATGRLQGRNGCHGIGAKMARRVVRR